MNLLLAEMTRKEIQRIAPHTTVVLPTASMEQHGPHLPICTDSLLCETVVYSAALEAAEHIPVAVAPLLCYGNSHHHFPFAGVLSLTSHTFMAIVTEVLESLVRCGFRKLVVLNSHGGNADANSIVAQDFVNRLEHPVSIVSASYWEIARVAVMEKGLISNELIPGHAGHFETALMMAIRPELVNQDGLAQVRGVSKERSDSFTDPAGTSAQSNDGWTASCGFPRAIWDGAFLPVRVHGDWADGRGYTDDPAAATIEEGRVILDVIVHRVADFLVAFHS